MTRLYKARSGINPQGIPPYNENKPYLHRVRKIRFAPPDRIFHSFFCHLIEILATFVINITTQTAFAAKYPSKLDIFVFHKFGFTRWK